MTLETLLKVLRTNPLIASVQASPGSPLDDTSTLLNLARASLDRGVRVLRMEGKESIDAATQTFDAPIIGLIKRDYPGSPVRITPTHREVTELLSTSVPVIALDATVRIRPDGASFNDLVKAVHDHGRLVLADCDTLMSARQAIEAGADLVSTTLSGYTVESPLQAGPDLDLLRSLVELAVPVLAEGRYSEPTEIQAAMRIGALGVVVGGALNDPVKQTEKFVAAAAPAVRPIGAFDIGGTWIRFGVFDEHWKLQSSSREPLPQEPEDRSQWMATKVIESGSTVLGISTGGNVDPLTAEVWEAKPLIPEHEGVSFRGLAKRVVALNDGLAAAWGHACLPRFAGKRIATIALGTGVGCGLVDRGRILMGERGEAPRLNDLSLGSTTIEEALGGQALSESGANWEFADLALRHCIDAVQKLWLPDSIVICGSVGLSSRLAEIVASLGCEPSPFGSDAGLYGAAALALFSPIGLTS